MIEKLLNIIDSADEQTVLICGDKLAYYQNGEERFDNSVKWSLYFDDIIANVAFICERENMQLIVKLKK